MLCVIGGVGVICIFFGVSNLFCNIVFIDINNQQCYQMQGWYLLLINSVKQFMVIGGVYVLNILVGYGNNWDVQSVFVIVVIVIDILVQFYYYVLFVYSKVDLCGVMWVGVVNVVVQLQFEINLNLIVVVGVDFMFVVYLGSVGGWKIGIMVKLIVWQDYVDQIVMDKNGQLILLQDDFVQFYSLNIIMFSVLVQGQDYGVFFVNFCNFLFIMIVYDNGGQFNVGLDINSFVLQIVNSLNIFKYGLEEVVFFVCFIFMVDLLFGMYYFDYCSKFISMQQFGNIQIIVNFLMVNNNVVFMCGFEYFLQVLQVVFVGLFLFGG